MGASLWLVCAFVIRMQQSQIFSFWQLVSKDSRWQSYFVTVFSTDDKFCDMFIILKKKWFDKSFVKPFDMGLKGDGNPDDYYVLYERS